MTDTFTVNYKFVKPTVGGDGFSWAQSINADLDAIDTVLASLSVKIAAAGATLVIPTNIAGNLLGFDGAKNPIAVSINLTPFINTPAVGTPLARVQSVSLYDGLTLPPLLLVRELARDGTSRCRFRIAAYTAPTTYVPIIAESAGSLVYIDATGLTGPTSIPLYALDTSLGVAAGAQVGVATIDFGDGSAFGTYYTLTYDYTAGGLVSTKLTTAPGILSAITTRVTSAIQAERIRPVAVFQPPVTDSYLTSLVVEAHPENAEPGRSYVLNYETIFYAGIPLYRAQFFLYDPVLGVNVAQWAFQSASSFTLPSTVFLTACAGGLP